MKRKRNVGANLGRTQHRLADRIYARIRIRVGSTRRCPYRGKRSRGPQRDDMHDVLNPTLPNPNVPIEEFDFLFIKRKKHWDLQTYCKVCHKDYRGGRSREAHERFDPMTDNEVRTWYIKNVGPTMRCSVCREEKIPNEFGISRGMEKGLHNECLICQFARGASVREQEWMADGDWSSWTYAVQSMRKKSRVKCAGWSRSVTDGTCQGTLPGKRMHADHIVPLRAGGLHDAVNFQPLCDVCNTRKSDQIDPAIRPKRLRKLVGARLVSVIKDTDSSQTIERKLKNSLALSIGRAIKNGSYKTLIAAVKKRVNGQWIVDRAFRKGVSWYERWQLNKE